MNFDQILQDPKVQMAVGMASIFHGNQSYGDRPYMEHVRAVAQLVFERGNPGVDNVVPMVCAAILHDTLEDTALTPEAIKRAFGDEVFNMVDACTKKDDDLCRACAFKRTVPRLLAVPGAVTIKLADRLANMQNALNNRSTHLNMYVREYPGFKKLLAPAGGNEKLWEALDEVYAKSLEKKK